MSAEKRITHPHAPRTGPRAAPLAEALFVPPRYEPNYAYPLLTLLHGRGGDEHQMVRSMSALGWRNYVGLGLQGIEPTFRRGQLEGFSWGPEFARPNGRLGRPTTSESPPAEVLRRLLRGETPDSIDQIEEGVFSAVLRARRTLHIHSERLFLVGTGEGAAVAYRLGLTYPERFAGVVALNGWIPNGFRPFGRLKACRDLRILVVHGEWNARAPIGQARRDVALLRAAGLRVAFQSYPCAHRLTAPMLADVDTWLINQCMDGR
jgi:phospholipase/carboxylesterase